jgi:hypothetical protein
VGRTRATENQRRRPARKHTSRLCRTVPRARGTGEESLNDFLRAANRRSLPRQLKGCAPREGHSPLDWSLAPLNISQFQIPPSALEIPGIRYIFDGDDVHRWRVNALMLKQNDEWSVSRRYMTPETIGAFSDNPASACQHWQPDHPWPDRGSVFLYYFRGATCCLGEGDNIPKL